MRLTDDLAAHRRLYTFPLPTAPVVVLIDIPRHYASESLPLGRFYPIIVETAEELVELETFLTAERSEPVPPDLFARRPSHLAATCITFFQYCPSEPGWPWLLLCHWPKTYTQQVEEDGEMLARDAYTIEMFKGQSQLLAATAQFARILGSEVRIQTVLTEGVAAGYA
jgi:hypothetical protein